MLKIEALNQYHGESHTLWDLDIDARKGQCTVLMGRNGVGKTTLLQCILGLLPIRSGRIKLEDREIQKMAAESRAKMGIAYVPQGRQIFPRLSVEENLTIGLPARSDKLKKIPEPIYEMFPVLKEMLSRQGGDLSGGQQQQLAIARALVTDPSVLILDEPTEGIKPNIVAEIGEIIGKLNKEMGLTVLIVEQKLPFARRVGDRFFIMDRGRTVASDTMSGLTDELVRQYLTV